MDKELLALLERLGLAGASIGETRLALSAHPVALYSPETQDFAKWIPLVVPGDDGILRTIKGNWRVDIPAIISAWRALGNEMVIDYEHHSLPGYNSGHPAPAAGWIKDLAEASGVLFALVEWTPRAREYIAAGEYKYLSPVPVVDDSGVVFAVLNVALTNNPATIDAIPIALSTNIIAAKDGKEDTTMDLQKLLAALGLAPDATEAAAVAAIQALQDTQAKALTALGLQGSATPAEIEGKIIALSGNSSRLEELQKQVEALNADNKKREAEKLVALAINEGKLAPAQVEWAKDYALQSPDGFGTWLKNAQPLTALSKGLTPDGKTAEGGLAPGEKAIMAALGVSEDDYAKYGKGGSK